MREGVDLATAQTGRAVPCKGKESRHPVPPGWRLSVSHGSAQGRHRTVRYLQTRFGIAAVQPVSQRHKRGHSADDGNGGKVGRGRVG